MGLLTDFVTLNARQVFSSHTYSLCSEKRERRKMKEKEKG